MRERGWLFSRLAVVTMTSTTSFSLAKRMPEACSGFHLSGFAFLLDTCRDAQLSRM